MHFQLILFYTYFITFYVAIMCPKLAAALSVATRHVQQTNELFVLTKPPEMTHLSTEL